MAAPGDFPSGNEGDELTAEFTVLGTPFIGLNGGQSSSPIWRRRSWLRRRTRPRPTAIRTRLSATAARKAPAAGARTVGASPQITPRQLLEACSPSPRGPPRTDVAAVGDMLLRTDADQARL